MKVQLLWFPGCPNAGAAREALRRSLAAAGLPPAFEDVDVTATGAPAHLRRWGSPTILVNGRDVAGGSPTGASCRIYGAGSNASGVPPDDLIARALAEARGSRRPWVRSMAVLPGAAVSLLPSATCPACIAAYAGVASSLGLGFLFNDRILAPLIGVLLAVGLVTVGWSARSHRRAGPLLVTILGSAAVVAGRLVWSVPAMLYGGAALLVGASLWNLWLKRPRPEALVQLRLAPKD